MTSTASLYSGSALSHSAALFHTAFERERKSLRKGHWVFTALFRNVTVENRKYAKSIRNGCPPAPPRLGALPRFFQNVAVEQGRCGTFFYCL